MIFPGLVSVTFRQFPPEEIVEMACQAGLAGIEWGGDIHVPPGDLDQARRVGEMTRSSGLRVVSYGSYYRVWPQEPAPFDTILNTALALGAPAIRVWAGKSASQQVKEAERAQIVGETRRIASLAAQAGVSVAFEFHANTLTDTDDSAVDLLQQANHPNALSYWQPRVACSPQVNLESLKRMAPWLQHLHIFHWSTAGGTLDRRPLAEGYESLRSYLAFARLVPGDRFAMLEFVRGDSPQSFLEDAAVLNDLCH